MLNIVWVLVVYFSCFEVQGAASVEGNGTNTCIHAILPFLLNTVKRQPTIPIGVAAHALTLVLL